MKYYTPHQCIPLKAATRPTGVVTQPFFSKQIVHSNDAAGDIPDRIVGVGSMQGGGRGEDLNCPPRNTQPQRKFEILKWKKAHGPSAHIFKCLTSDYHAAGAVPEASVSSQIIFIVYDSDFVRHFFSGYRRQFTFELPHAGKHERGPFFLGNPVVDNESSRKQNVIAVKKYEVFTYCKGGPVVASRAGSLIGFKAYCTNRIAILPKNLRAPPRAGGIHR